MTNHHVSLPIWDGFIRLFHWALLAAVGLAALTGFLGGATTLWLHLIGGLAAVALVIARIIWGFSGGGAARFRGFVPGPGAVLDHLRGRGGRHLGHNPLGALMVLALLAIILGLGVTGGLALGGVFKIGPFAADGLALGRISLEGHEVLALGLLGLVVAHVAGVLFESRRSRENLAAAMVRGRKELRPGDHLPPAIGADRGSALWMGAVVVGLAAILWAALGLRPVVGLPVPMPDAVRGACAECHTAYHASLLPAARWRTIMSDLSDHFGEDASLDPDTTVAVTDWLTGHAAEIADTLPSDVFAQPDADQPLRITATKGWVRLHDDLAPDVFKRTPVGSAANCAACHKDAETGRFSPFAIDLPKEVTP